MKKPNANVSGNWSKSVFLYSLRNMQTCARIKNTFIKKLAVPNVIGRMRLVTYGRLDICEVPSPAFVKRAMPAAVKSIPATQTVQRLIISARAISLTLPVLRVPGRVP